MFFDTQLLLELMSVRGAARGRRQYRTQLRLANRDDTLECVAMTACVRIVLCTAQASAFPRTRKRPGYCYKRNSGNARTYLP